MLYNIFFVNFLPKNILFIEIILIFAAETSYENKTTNALMRNLSNHWYKIIGLVCAFLFLLMVYRREARMRAHIENMEARLEALELYSQGKERADSIRIHATTVPTENKSTTESPVRRPDIRRQTRNESHAKSNPIPKTSPVAPEEKAEEESYTGKFRQVVRLELNTVDSATLVRVPGIGEGTAKAILLYREKLGGYYSPEQLREKITWESAQKNLDSWCNEWFWADENLIRKLQINKLSFKELVHHPYLSYEEVKAIVKWRERHEKVHNVADLEQIGITDSTHLAKLLHYVEF